MMTFFYILFFILVIQNVQSFLLSSSPSMTPMYQHQSPLPLSSSSCRQRQDHRKQLLFAQTQEGEESEPSSLSERKNATATLAEESPPNGNSATQTPPKQQPGSSEKTIAAVADAPATSDKDSTASETKKKEADSKEAIVAAASDDVIALDSVDDQCWINDDCNHEEEYDHPLKGESGGGDDDDDNIVIKVDVSSQVFHDDVLDNGHPHDDDKDHDEYNGNNDNQIQDNQATKLDNNSPPSTQRRTEDAITLQSTLQRYSSFQDQIRTIIAMDNALRWGPAIIPIVAYMLYDPTAAGFAKGLDLIANNNWVAVDGGSYQAKIIAPAINGVVIPAIAILFANLIGTTISALRQRQVDIRGALNQEAGQLRILQVTLDGFPTPQDREVCRRYLVQYTTRLIAESQPTVSVNQLDYSLDTELNGVLAELNRLSYLATNPPPPPASPTLQQQVATTNPNNSQSLLASLSPPTLLPEQHVSPNPMILGNAFGACQRLYEERSNRITALRSLFPPLHFMIVATLAVSICVAFLLESNQDLLMFLNAIQLRILWTMLVGTFSALAIVCYDLSNPFRGSYQISKTVDQLYTIRLTLRASLRAEATTTTTTAAAATQQTARTTTKNEQTEQSNIKRSSSDDDEDESPGSGGSPAGIFFPSGGHTSSDLFF